VAGLRTVTVLEHETVAIIDDDTELAMGSLDSEKPWFTTGELAALLQINDRRRGFCNRTFQGVKLAQYCGIVRLSTCILEVLPKFGGEDDRAPGEVAKSRSAFLGLLRRAGPNAVTKLGGVSQEAVHAPLLDVFIENFLICALDQAKRGLLSRYMVQADDLPVIKGRFNVHTNCRRNATRPHVLHCEYDEFTADNSHNRAIRHTLDTCRTWIRSGICQRLWLEVSTRYANISPVEMTAADIGRLPRDRITNRYDTVLTWCQWFLRTLSPSIRSGDQEAPGILFDMNKLFETYVLCLEQAVAAESQIVLAQGPVKSLADQGGSEAFRLKPDVTLWTAMGDSGRSIVKIVDAKWKRLNPSDPNWGIEPGDVYQLLAYAMRYGCRRLELVYPMPAGASQVVIDGTQFTIDTGLQTGGPISIRVKAVPLWPSPNIATSHPESLSVS
jgi:5-methylcytosine-specific restriction enzyme subunit McrC